MHEEEDRFPMWLFGIVPRTSKYECLRTLSTFAFEDLSLLGYGVFQEPEADYSNVMLLGSFDVPPLAEHKEGEPQTFPELEALVVAFQTHLRIEHKAFVGLDSEWTSSSCDPRLVDSSMKLYTHARRRHVERFASQTLEYVFPLIKRPYYGAFPIRVLNNLYQSDRCENKAGFAKVVEQLGVTGVINCAAEIGNTLPEGVEELRLGLYDDDEQQLFPAAIDAWQFFQKHAKNGRVLVHCAAGISRSSAIGCFLLMKEGKKSFPQAFAQLKEVHPKANPNAHFRTQLELYDQESAGF